MSAPFEFAVTPAPPYYAVVFTSLRSSDQTGYAEMAERMVALAREQPGFLGIESTGEEGAAITVSYWDTLEHIRAWREHLDHAVARARGKETWYRGYRLRVARVEREVGFDDEG